jgi:tRNA modification GTPase
VPPNDTIVAPITATGGAVAVVRVSGPGSWRVARAVFELWPDPVEPRRAVYGPFSTGDDGLALPFPAGGGYTGEEAVEFSVHGSHASVTALIEACLDAGARLAEPGEFSLRAFMNGRLDLTQAEGVRALVEARTSAQLRQAARLREGATRDAVRTLRQEVLGVLAAVEAATDFEDETGPLDRTRALERANALIAAIGRLLLSARASRIVQDGLTVAIVGLPNAGKSSLFNAVLGSDRAIVTPIPGTTRDTVEEHVSVDGRLVRLIDTAGLRETMDAVEALGVGRTRDATASADVVWYVYDAAQGWSTADDSECPQGAVVVANKSDLAAPARGLPVSAVTGEGLPALLSTLQSSEPGSIVLPRHAANLREARRALRRVKKTLGTAVPDDLAAVDLCVAARHLGEITGETAPPDVIERVFRDFCIGK